MPPYLTLKDTAARFNTTINQVKRLVHNGKLRAINIGAGEIKGRYRFAAADIADFERQQRVGEEPLCPSSNRRSQRRTTGSISRSAADGFMALRDAQRARKPK